MRNAAIVVTCGMKPYDTSFTTQSPLQPISPASSSVSLQSPKGNRTS